MRVVYLQAWRNTGLFSLYAVNDEPLPFEHWACSECVWIVPGTIEEN